MVLGRQTSYYIARASGWDKGEGENFSKKCGPFRRFFLSQLLRVSSVRFLGQGTGTSVGKRRGKADG